MLALFLSLLILLAAGLVLLDTAPGHRFIVDRIAGIETASGLRIRIGRIDGSVFGKSKLRNVAVSDTRGVFLTAPVIELDWAPGAWLYNSLHIDRLYARQVRLTRLPKLKPTGRKGPILPGFDIHVGELSIRRLEIGPQVSGQPRVGTLRGKADIRGGPLDFGPGSPGIQGYVDRVGRPDAEDRVRRLRQAAGQRRVVPGAGERVAPPDRPGCSPGCGA